MGILIVAAVATALGFLLIFLIGRGQPVSPAAPENLARDGQGAMSWVRGFGLEGFQRLLLTLFTEMGFHAERSERGSGTVDLFANDPTPIRGGRLYVHGLFGEPGVPTDADEVRNMIETARPCAGRPRASCSTCRRCSRRPCCPPPAAYPAGRRRRSAGA